MSSSSNAISELFLAQALSTPTAPALVSGGAVVTFDQVAAAVRDRDSRPASRSRWNIVDGERGDVAGVIRLMTALCVEYPVAVVPHLADSYIGSLARAQCLAGAESVAIFTSGSAGSPKAVILSRSGLLAGLCASLALQKDIGLLREEELFKEAMDASLGMTFFAPMPVHTIAGLTVLLRALLTGGTAVLCPDPLDAAAVAHLWIEERVNSAALTPFLARVLLRALRSSHDDFPDLHFVGIGGASTPREIASELESRLECPIASGYGSTEIGGPALMGRWYDPPEDRWSSVGRPLPGVTIQLADVDETGVGEVVCNAGSQMIGYGDSVAQPRDSFIRTGDLARIQSSGCVEICGRKSATIMRSGRRIDPARVEAQLEGHPAVDRAGVLSVRAPLIPEEEVIVALYSSDSPVSSRSLRTYLRTRLEPAEVPRRFVWCQHVPLSRDGSVARSSLRAAAEASLRRHT